MSLAQMLKALQKTKQQGWLSSQEHGLHLEIGDKTSCSAKLTAGDSDMLSHGVGSVIGWGGWELAGPSQPLTPNTLQAFFFFFFFFLFFFWLFKEVPRLRVKSELWLLAYTTATATQDRASPATCTTAHHNSGSLTH